MTETEARALLRRWPGLGGLEAWIVEQEWQPTPGGWIVIGSLRGWRFRIGIVPGSLDRDRLAGCGLIPLGARDFVLNGTIAVWRAFGR